jgi:CBS domain-containing protein
MKVQDIMTVSPETCRASDNLAEAVSRMWKVDCGVLPVVDDAGRLAGIVTDRDICIALGTRDERASQVDIRTVMRTSVAACDPQEDVIAALARMGEYKVRRLPVVDGERRLVGMLSLSDAMRAAGSGRQAVRPGAVLEALRTITAIDLPVRCEHVGA